MSGTVPKPDICMTMGWRSLQSSFPDVNCWGSGVTRIDKLGLTKNWRDQAKSQREINSAEKVNLSSIIHHWNYCGSTRSSLTGNGTTEIDHLGKGNSAAADLTLATHFQVSREEVLGSQSSNLFYTIFFPEHVFFYLPSLTSWNSSSKHSISKNFKIRTISGKSAFHQKYGTHTFLQIGIFP